MKLALFIALAGVAAIVNGRALPEETPSSVSLATTSSFTLAAPEDMTRIVAFDSAPVPVFLITSTPTSDSTAISSMTSSTTSTVSAACPVVTESSASSSTTPCMTLISSTITQLFYDETGVITRFRTEYITATDGSCGSAISMTDSASTMITLTSTAIASSTTSSPIFQWFTKTVTLTVPATGPSITPS
ncbi:hypothetical protein F5B22DRAFT_649419 [Xylaria bambusicola]|uniref:uncharacterized protein n=1 Tax=Xylaria bambusicola TaxID=326684 RepID=UPI0020087B07|nr:uncharacterized protein F5B22DRAFT_649419 [Xylaria bambusicola]KAI0509144.1 hypothetical protein F5B22DRAFT_649419 [Xylaria bambusicola]